MTLQILPVNCGKSAGWEQVSDGVTPGWQLDLELN